MANTYAANKKSMVFGDREVHRAVAVLSKAALGDLVVDLLRRCEGAEDLDGAALVSVLAEAVEPVLLVRGDKTPKELRR
jgi:hypothetical protein